MDHIYGAHQLTQLVPSAQSVQPGSCTPSLSLQPTRPPRKPTLSTSSCHHVRLFLIPLLPPPQREPQPTTVPPQACPLCPARLHLVVFFSASDVFGLRNIPTHCRLVVCFLLAVPTLATHEAHTTEWQQAPTKNAKEDVVDLGQAAACAAVHRGQGRALALRLPQPVCAPWTRAAARTPHIASVWPELKPPQPRAQARPCMASRHQVDMPGELGRGRRSGAALDGGRLIFGPPNSVFGGRLVSTPACRMTAALRLVHAPASQTVVTLCFILFWAFNLVFSLSTNVPRCPPPSGPVSPSYSSIAEKNKRRAP